MKRQKIRFCLAVSITVAAAGIARGELLAYETFKASSSPDYGNGVYLHNTDIADTNGNAICVDASTNRYIVGFSTNDAWRAYGSGSYFDAYYGVLKLNKRSYSQDIVGRKHTAEMGGKNTAWARVGMRMFAGTGSNTATGKVLAGWASSYALGSSGGATVGFKWDDTNQHWDLVMRYNNGLTSGAYATILENAAYDTVYNFFWFMDDARNLVKVWLTTGAGTVADCTDAPDVVITDWVGASVSEANYLSIAFQYTGDSDVYIYDAWLGDNPEDIGMNLLPQDGLLVHEEFNSSYSDELSFTNGIYRSWRRLIGDQVPQGSCYGGTILGFDSSTAWEGSSYFDAFEGAMRMKKRTYSPTYIGRAITNSLVGLTKAYARTSVRMLPGTGASGNEAFAVIGFASDATLGSSAGAAVGYEWDANTGEWDLALRYFDGTQTTTETIMTNAVYDLDYTIYWKMDADADTIDVWVNESDTKADPALTVTNWAGTVEGITHLGASHAQTRDSDVYVYAILLGETPESIDMEPPITSVSAEILSIAPFSDNVMELVIRADHPSFCYLKSRTSLPLGTWGSIGHSTNGAPPFVITNLTYSSASGADYVIYVEAAENKKFIKIGAE